MSTVICAACSGLSVLGLLVVALAALFHGDRIPEDILNFDNHVYSSVGFMLFCAAITISAITKLAKAIGFIS